MPVETLVRLVNRDGQQRLSEDQVPEVLERFGVEVDELTATTQYVCRVCGKIIERTEAQGEPLACSNCGTDFREKPETLGNLGEQRVVRLDMLAVRPDIFDPGGMARALRGFLGIQTGLVEYPLEAPRLSVRVDPRLAEPDSYRPFIACAVLRNVSLDHDRIRMLMNLQEDLHWALGRDRKLASIGVYDLSTLTGEAFHYEAVEPDGLKFVPLGFSPDDPAAALTPREILARHPTGQKYAKLLAGFSRYPLLRDGAGTVLSMPPIINSEPTRVTMNTRECFVDVTGTSQRTVDRALNVLVTSLRELMPEMTIEQVTIHGIDGDRTTPDLRPAEMPLELPEVCDTIGVGLNVAELRDLLERMGHGVDVEDADRVAVRVPAWRNDVMHPIDLIEDAAIAYGYDNLEPRLVPTFTIGSARAIEEESALARRAMAGLGFHQVMTLTLTSEKAAYERWGVEPDPRRVQIENPISVEQTICRTTLLPGLLETLSINKQYELPQQIFEVGDCSFVDETAETGAREERFVAAAMIGTHVGYADIRAVGDALVFEMGGQMAVEPTEHPGFIAGRVAELRTPDGQRLGIMGEVHPQVLENYGLKHPVAVFELSLEKLLATRMRNDK